MSSTKALVFGSTGQLGSNLVRALLDQGYGVRTLIRPSSNATTLSGLEIERVLGNLNDSTAVEKAVRGMTLVFHAAGYYPDQYIPVDLALVEARRQTEHVISAVQKNPSIKKLVFASTLTTIGPSNTLGRMADETCEFRTTFLDNPYLMAKHAMEQSVLEAATHGLPAVVVNPTVFYGPFDSKPSTGRHILTIAKRMMPAYVQGPVNVIDVRDVAEGMIRAAEVGRAGERYILGNWNTTHQELDELIARVAGVMPPLVAVPFSLARSASKLGEWGFQALLRRQSPLPSFLVEMLAHVQHYDCSKAIQELGYPRSPIEQAIRDALSWFRNNGYL